MDDLELLRSMFDASPDALWLMGFDGEILRANQAMADLVGCELSELPNVSSSRFTDDQGKVDFERHLQMMRDGHPGVQNEEVLVVRLDGTQGLDPGVWSPLRRADGTVAGYLHRLTEYTERRRLLEELQQREADLRTAHRIARLGSWAWEVASDTVVVERRALRHLRGRRQDLRANWDATFDRLHPEDREAVQSLVFDAMRHRDSFQWESRLLVSPAGCGGSAATGRSSATTRAP